MGSLVVGMGSLKRYTAKQILVTTAVGAVGSVCTGGRVASRLALWVFRWWLFFALLFLVFDVEAVFIYPWSVLLKELGWSAMVSMGLFMSTLVVGLIYVWRKGALTWV
jgi:NADH:ubiquinone oxidoreductase subunit 3 (subunit A)